MSDGDPQAAGIGRTLRVVERDEPGPAFGPLDLLACGGLVLAVLIAFWPALGAGFVNWDDPVFVTDNPYIRGLSGENIRWMFTQPRGGHYHPLTWLSWAIDYQLWGGLKPAGFHLTNILLHAANAVLVYILIRRLVQLAASSGANSGGALRLASWIGAAVFAVHPLRAESVAWVTERRDVLSVLFLLGAALAYLRSVRVGDPSIASRSAYAASLLLLVLSCLSKGWGMIFFALLIVLDAYPLRRLTLSRDRWRAAARVLAQKLPFMLLGVATAIIAGRSSASSMSVKTLAEWGVVDRVVQAAYGLWFYTLKTFVPVRLSPLYAIPARTNPWEPRFIAAYVFIGLAAALVLALARRRPALATCAAAYGVTLAPVLGLLQSGEQLVADRYSYIACLVYPILLAGGLYAMLGQKTEGGTDVRKIGKLVAAGGCVMVLALAALCNAQTAAWTSTETLWASAIQNAPSAQALTEYGLEIERQGRGADAEQAFAAAVRLRPDDGKSWYAYANRLRDAGKFDAAATAYEQAARFMAQPFMAHVNLGSMYMNRMNRPQEGVRSLRAAVEDVERGGKPPASALPYLALGNALRRIGDLAGAREQLLKARSFDETRAQAERELAALAEDERNAGSVPARP